MSATDVLGPDEIQPYLAAADWLTEVVGREEIGAAWDSPSTLAGYRVGGVAAHAVSGGLLRLLELVQAPEPPPAGTVTAADYYGANRVDDPRLPDPFAGAVREMSVALAGRGQGALVERGRAARMQLERLLPLTESGRAVPVLRLVGATTTVADYVRTRVLELMVHGDDLVASVPGSDFPDPPAVAMEVCLELCVELARARLGDAAALRAFTRRERSRPDALWVL